MSDAHFDPNFDFHGFAKRMAEAMFPEKVTAFAARVGVPQPTVSKYLSGSGASGPRVDLVAKIAEGLSCSIDWLVYGRGDGPADLTGIVKVPRFDSTLAAGAGSWNDGRRRLDEIPFTTTFLQRRLARASTKGLSVLEAAGDSMEPTIHDGALVLIDEEDRRVTDGVFAFVYEGDARIKRFRKTMDGIILISDNPLYPPELVAGERQALLQVIGRAKWVGQML